MGGHLNDTHAINVADFEALARPRLDDAARAYFGGGAADEITLRDNRAAWDALRLVPRVLRALADLDTAVTLLGRRWPTPLDRKSVV